MERGQRGGMLDFSIIWGISGVEKDNIKTQFFATEQRGRVSKNRPAILFSFANLKEKARIQGPQKPTCNP
jgi:hypothetical protein